MKKLKKLKKVKLKNVAANKTAKGKTYDFVELDDGTLVPRDTTYPVDAPGHHTADGGAA
jgi:hypothetical protein